MNQKLICKNDEINTNNEDNTENRSGKGRMSVCERGIMCLGSPVSAHYYICYSANKSAGSFTVDLFPHIITTVSPLTVPIVTAAAYQ